MQEKYFVPLIQFWGLLNRLPTYTVAQVIQLSVPCMAHAIHGYCAEKQTSIRYIPRTYHQKKGTSYDMAIFPNELGIINSTHVAIVSAVDNEEICWNRNYFHNMNMQMQKYYNKRSFKLPGF